MVWVWTNICRPKTFLELWCKGSWHSKHKLYVTENTPLGLQELEKVLFPYSYGHTFSIKRDGCSKLLRLLFRMRIESLKFLSLLLYSLFYFYRELLNNIQHIFVLLFYLQLILVTEAKLLKSSISVLNFLLLNWNFLIDVM